MNVWALLPVQPFEEGKTRLSSVLDGPMRADLNRKFFRHVLGVALEVFGPQRVLVISRAADVLDAVHAQTLKESYSGDLNRALTEAAEVAAENGADAVLSLSSDLPLLE